VVDEVRGRRIILALLLICVIAYAGSSILAAGAPATVSYDFLSTEPLKCSELLELLEERYNMKFLLTSYSHLRETDQNSVLVIMGPTKPFTRSEARGLEDFAQNGGRVIIIADNDGAANALQIGGMQISKAPLRDFLNFEKRPDFVLLKDFSPHAMFENVGSILTNYPAAVLIENYPYYPPWEGYPPWERYHPAQILASSSELSFLDENRNGFPDQGEPIGPHAVIAEAGNVIAIADPGIFVNDMIDRANNRQFAVSLFEYATDGGSRPVVFDLTHTEYSSPLWLHATAFIRDTSLLALLAFASVASIISGLYKYASKLAAVKRLGGLFSRRMRVYAKKLRTPIKPDLNEPLMVYYEHFLGACSKAFGLKKPDPDEVLKRIQTEYPHYHKRMKAAILSCERVRAGVLDLRSPDAFRRTVKYLSDFEKMVGGT